MSLMDAIAFENTVSGLACLLQSMCRRRVGSPYAQIVSSTERQAFETRSPACSTSPSHPPSLWKLCVSGNLILFKSSFPTIFKHRNPVQSLIQTIPLLGFDSFAGVLWIEPRPHIQRMDGLSSEDCSRPICPEFFKLLLVLTCRSFGFILFSLTKKE